MRGAEGEGGGEADKGGSVGWSVGTARLYFIEVVGDGFTQPITQLQTQHMTKLQTQDMTQLQAQDMTQLQAQDMAQLQAKDTAQLEAQDMT